MASLTQACTTQAPASFSATRSAPRSSAATASRTASRVAASVRRARSANAAWISAARGSGSVFTRRGSHPARPGSRVRVARRGQGNDHLPMAALRSIESLPEVSGARPLLGHAPEMNRDRAGFMRKIVAEVDRIARVRAFHGLPIVAVNHPETMQELLVERHPAFDKSIVARFALYPLIGEGLFTSRGELWRRQRRRMAPLFHPGRVAAFGADMVACTERAIAEWRDGEERSLLRETTRITMSVAGKTLFQTDTFVEADEIGHALTVALD